MKKTIFTLTAFAFIASSVLTSCSTSSEKVENAQEKVEEANEDLNKASEEYLDDVAKYKKEIADKIEANNKSVTDFNLRIENDKALAKADYKKKINELDQKNSDLKKKMDDYKAEGKESWEIFKAEFSRDMDDLGASFKNLTIKNVK